MIRKARLLLNRRKDYLNIRTAFLFSFSLICLIYSLYCYFPTIGKRQVYVVAQYQSDSLQITNIRYDQAGYPAGLRLGDVILKIGDQDVDTYMQQHAEGFVEFRDYPYYYYPSAFYHWPYHNGQQIGIMSLQARYLTVERPSEANILLIDLDSFTANANQFWLLNICLFISLVFLIMSDLFLLLRPSMSVTVPMVFVFNLIAVLIISRQANLTEINPVLDIFSLIAANFAPLAFIHLLLYFPNKIEPKRWVAYLLAIFYLANTLICMLLVVADLFMSANNIEFEDIINGVNSLNYLLLALFSIVVLVYRYVGSNGSDRLRMRLLTLAFFVVITYFIFVIVSSSLFGWFDYTLTYEKAKIYLITIVIPIVLIYSTLRHNLFFTDLIVRTSLIYSLLSFLLGVLYFSLNNILSFIVYHRLGTSNDTIGFITMLALAIGVSKTRNFSQFLIDRAFYRVNLDYPRLLNTWSNRLAANNTDLYRLMSSLTDLKIDFQYKDLALLFLEASTKDKRDSDYILSRAFNSNEGLYQYGTLTVVRSNNKLPTTTTHNTLLQDEKAKTPSNKLYDTGGIITLLEPVQLAKLDFQQTMFSVSEAPALTFDKTGFVENLPSIKGGVFNDYQFLILFSHDNSTSSLYGGLLVGDKLSNQLPTPLERSVLQIITNQMAQSLLTAIKVQEQMLAHQIIHELLIDKDTAVEQERISFSNELHDVIKQTTVALSNTVNALVESPELTTPNQNNLVKNLKIRSDLLLDQTQALLQRIRAGVLIEMGGLEGLVKGLDDTMLEILNLQPEINFSFDENFEVHNQKYLRQLTPEQNMHLTRIAKQAIENALKHGKATGVAISLTVESEKEAIAPTLILTVRDNGSGFDVNQYDFYQLVKNKHIGLQGMRERTKKLGGNFNIESIIGQGTTVSVTIPLKRISEVIVTTSIEDDQLSAIS